MTLIWGKSCRVCGNTANEGDYCERCYEQQFPVCEYCKKPIRDGEEEVDNCHKKPCYSDKTGRCCECGAITSRGSYCKRYVAETNCEHRNYLWNVIGKRRPFSRRLNREGYRYLFDSFCQVCFHNVIAISQNKIIQLVANENVYGDLMTNTARS